MSSDEEGNQDKYLNSEENTEAKGSSDTHEASISDEKDKEENNHDIHEDNEKMEEGGDEYEDHNY